MAVFALDKYSTACACAREKCSDDCSFYREYKQKLKPTINYDRLRAMSVEEMAEFLADVVNDAVDKGLYVKGFLDTRYKTSLWIEWLKMEVADDGQRD